MTPTATRSSPRLAARRSRCPSPFWIVSTVPSLARTRRAVSAAQAVPWDFVVTIARSTGSSTRSGGAFVRSMRVTGTRPSRVRVTRVPIAPRPSTATRIGPDDRCPSGVTFASTDPLARRRASDRAPDEPVYRRGPATGKEGEMAATARPGAMSDDMGLMPQNRTGRTVVVSGVLAAIQLALGFTGIGFIPLPTGVNATILHIPAILAGVMEGPIAGAAVGFIFGLFSFLRATTPLFQNPIIAFGPRILIGVVAFLVYKALRPFNEVVALLAAGVLGTLTNTALVLSLAVLLKGPNGQSYLPADVAWTVAGTNGIPEAIVGGIITLAVGLAVRGAGRARKSTV